jgi:hypothetical protein
LGLAANVELNVVAFTNASGIGAVASGNAFGGAPAAALTTTHANSWVYGVGFDWSQGLARTLGSGQTMVDQVLQPGGTFWTQSETVPTAASGTTVTINDTAPSTDYWNLALVEILGSASAPSAPVITSAAAATFAVGSAGSFTVVASGSPASAFSETGGLPSGVTLSSAGVLSGTPAAGSAASYPITITAANGVLPNATQSFTLTVNSASAGAPTIDTKTTAFSATGTASASVSTTKSSDLVVAFVSADKPGPGSGQTATVSGGGLTWTLARRTNTQPGTAEIWTAPAPAVLTNAAITATLALAANVELNVVAFTNASGIGAVGGGNAFGGAPTAALTTTQANSWVFGVGFDWSQGLARTLGSGQTMVDQVLQPGGTFWTQSQTAATAKSGTRVTINDTAPTTDYWNLALVEIL